MSAFIVDKVHIDVLVTLAVRGPSDAEGRWNAFGPTRWRGTSPVGDYAQADTDTADSVGVMLWRENTNSIEDRYPDVMEGGDYPAVLGYTHDTPDGYTWDRRTAQVPVVAGLKAIACYEYQSCEHPGWPDSEAFRFCQALRIKLINALPGYDAAPWEISERYLKDLQDA